MPTIILEGVADLVSTLKPISAEQALLASVVNIISCSFIITNYTFPTHQVFLYIILGDNVCH